MNWAVRIPLLLTVLTLRQGGVTSAQSPSTPQVSSSTGPTHAVTHRPSSDSGITSPPRRSSTTPTGEPEWNLLNSVQPDVQTWQHRIGLPKHKDGCPNGTIEGALKIPFRWGFPEGQLVGGTTQIVHSASHIETCVVLQPGILPQGTYCIILFGEQCPNYFHPVTTTLYTALYPLGITVKKCCSVQGNSVMSTAWTRPFYLLPYNGSCQTVLGFKETLDHVLWKLNYSNSTLNMSHTFPRTSYKIYLCSYSPEQDRIELTSTSDPGANSGGSMEKIGIPNHKEGCPSTREMFNHQEWSVPEGYLTQGTTQIALGDQYVRTCVVVQISNLPEGKYCMLLLSATCPDTFKKETKTVYTPTSGPSGHKLSRCCRKRGQESTPIAFPEWTRPFYLIPYYDTVCQKVEGYQDEPAFVVWNINNTDTPTKEGEEVHHFRTVYKIHVCSYTPEQPVQESDDGFGIPLSIGLGISLSLAIACLCYKRRQLRRQKNREAETRAIDLTVTHKDKSKSKPEIGSLLTMVLDPDSQMTMYGLLIHPDKIETLEKVGKGAFGTVFEGRYRPDDNPLHVQDVAIKTLKDNCAYPEISAFMEEAIVMADFRHANVLTMVGVCVHPTTDVPTLVLPFMKYGDLQKYLRTFRYDDDLKDKIPELNQLLSFCLHIARGMTYLSDMKFVHRDLAARNCMLDTNMVVKVADFGLTRDIYANSYYRQDKNKLLPIKWMAIESLQDRVFSIYTDVWSYGVTVWEIFTLGKVPYPELENIQVLPELEKGQRLPKPDTCPDAVFDLVLECWSENPKDRPAFVDIAKVVEEALGGMSEYLDLDKSADKTVDLSSGVICSPRELAEIEIKENVPKTSYADYRETSLKGKQAA